MLNSSNRKYLEYFFLYLLALIFLTIIYVADVYVKANIAISVLYIVVIVYSWLLPGQKTSIYFGLLCSFLTIAAQLQSGAIGKFEDYNLINQFIAIIAIWISVILVSLSKRAFESFEDSLENAEKANDELIIAKEREVKNSIELYAKNKVLAQFARAASHDLQEPLITLKQTADLIQKRIDESDDRLLKKYLEYLMNSTTKMQLLIKGLMDYSRLGNNWKPQRVDVRLVLRELIKEVIEPLRNDNVKIEIHGELPNVMANRDELKMIFEIFINNSIKFRRENIPLNIEIEAFKDDDCWEFKFSDNGIGIPKRFQSKIFVLYKRMTNKKHLKGVGIGLSLAKKIVELHDGEIWVESEEGVGSTFYFTLPIRQPL